MLHSRSKALRVNGHENIRIDISRATHHLWLLPNKFLIHIFGARIYS